MRSNRSDTSTGKMAVASRQALKATRPRVSCYTLCFFFLVIVSGMVNMPALADQIYHSSPPGPSLLVVYDTEYGVPPDQTTVIVASPSGNLSALEFGVIAVLTNVLREGEAKDSPVLGVIEGQAIVEKDFSLYTAVTFVLNTDNFSGTISAQGVLNQSGAGELAITGGTSDFRWARGYVEIISKTLGPQVTGRKFSLHVKYD